MEFYGFYFFKFFKKSVGTVCQINVAEAEKAILFETHKIKMPCKQVLQGYDRARDWIRTSTTFRMLPPEDSASTNFATRAINQINPIKHKNSSCARDPD